MSWNYRVVRYVHADDDHTVIYGIHETYYDETGKPKAITKKPVGVTGDSLDELRTTYARMADALEKPVIEYNAGTSSLLELETPE